MAIKYNNNQFHLSTKNVSYIFCVNDNKRIIHCYWGERLNDGVDLTYTALADVFPRASAFSTPSDDTWKNFLCDMKFEFETIGNGDYRTPSIMVQHADGCRISEFEYNGYKIIDGKPALDGLPHTYAEESDNVQTLEISLFDKLDGIEVVLSYTVFEDYDVITRHVRCINSGAESACILNIQSATVDFDGLDYKLLHLYGEWARERSIEYIPVHHGNILLESNRTSSSHMENPFAALMDKNADEYNGNVYGFCLVYSGNFALNAEGSCTGTTRVTMGINPKGFEWELNPGESFTAPEVIMAYSPRGLDGMSQIYHRIIRERVCRGIYRDKVRPMLINNWEGTGMDFDEDKLYAIASNGAKAGLELFVVDDGWFGKRNDDRSSLGDWYVNKDKLPFGFKGLAKKVNGLGMSFGIWIEPEGINPDSDLYRAHPDWCVHAPGRCRTLNRAELVLDLSRDEVVKYLEDTFTELLESADISYVKWDYNRNISEYDNSMQLHKYVLGLYRLLETLTSRFPNILFEGCSGGGGRFDAGMLYYMPQTWTSDNTRPVTRLEIQYGTSLVYPICSMTGHVVKSHGDVVNTKDFMELSAHVAMASNFGFEIDMSKLSEDEIQQANGYIEQYRQIRETVQTGRFHRLESPFEGTNVSWQFVSQDGKESILFLYQTKSLMNGERRTVRLVDLQPDSKYECDGRIYYGDELMKLGITVPISAYEYESSIMIFKKAE